MKATKVTSAEMLRRLGFFHESLFRSDFNLQTKKITINDYPILLLTIIDKSGFIVCVGKVDYITNCCYSLKFLEDSPYVIKKITLLLEESHLL